MSTQGTLSFITPKNLLIKVLDKDPFGYNHQHRIDIGKHFLLKGVMYQGIHTLLDFYIYDWKGVKNEGRAFQALVLLS